MGETGAAFFGFRFLDCDTERLALSDYNDPILAARDGGIDQRAVEHNSMCALQIDTVVAPVNPLEAVVQADLLAAAVPTVHLAVVVPVAHSAVAVPVDPLAAAVAAAVTEA